MIIRQRQASTPNSSEITSESVYLNRRQLMKAAALGSAATFINTPSLAAATY